MPAASSGVKPALYWLVLLVNAGQATGVVLAPFGVGPIPPEVFRATVDVHGPVALLPSLVTDGGAVLLVVALGIFRRRWTADASAAQPVRRERVPPGQRSTSNLT